MSNILVVDDDEKVREIYRMVLEKDGHQIKEASNGNEAIASFNHESFDVILLDILMPSMSGDVVLQRARNNPKQREAKIIVITSYPGFRDKGIEKTADGFLVKPITPTAIRNAITSVSG